VGALGFAAGVLVLFALGWGAARITGHWRNGITPAEYNGRLQHLDDPAYSHPGM
jgi:hypothetical protein